MPRSTVALLFIMAGKIRLKQIEDCVGRCGTVADIGCDHGYLCADLLQSGKIKHAIAVDISAGSLQKARELAAALQLSEMECRQGNGLAPLAENEADYIVIAGMGGLLIKEILTADLKKAQRAKLVLSPHTHAGEIRRFLHENAFRIDREELVYEDKKYYQIICASAGSMSVENEFDYDFGVKLHQQSTTVYQDFLQCKLAQAKRVRKGLLIGTDVDAELQKNARVIAELERRIRKCR